MVVLAAGWEWVTQPVTVPLWALFAAVIVPVGWILQTIQQVAKARLGVELNGKGSE